jgi:4-hydroxybenzoate polyprenyltransferase
MTTNSSRTAVSLILALVEEIRPHQWAKNVLVFVPLVTSHRFFEMAKAQECALAFICLSLCASSIYIINDLFDLATDRRHPTKCRRPLASGRFPLVLGPPLALVLLTGGMGIALATGTRNLTICLFIYTTVSLAYSAWLKEYVLLDVFILAGLYILRIIAGGEATGIPISEWLMAFGLFFFLSLAFVKRYTELSRFATTSIPPVMRRGYNATDLNFIASIGCTSGYLAILIFALYINSPEMRQLYHRPLLLWLICPLLLYWITYLWLKAKRNELAEDPILFVIQDRASLLIGSSVLAIIVLASFKTLL